VEDVTERKRLERTQAILSAELQHRVKNILAKVQAAATLTLRSSKSLEEFAESFSGRLNAIVRAHDALFNNQWQPTNISTLLREALTPYLGERQLPLCIADIRLPPESAFAFNLITHELVTNAAKYGALSVPEGRVQIDCQKSDEQAGMAIFRWTEQGGPPAKPPRGAASAPDSSRASQRMNSRATSGSCPLQRVRMRDPVCHGGPTYASAEDRG
jgi:two-component sensor histidine kinase